MVRGWLTRGTLDESCQCCLNWGSWCEFERLSGFASSISCIATSWTANNCTWKLIHRRSPAWTLSRFSGNYRGTKSLTWYEMCIIDQLYRAFHLLITRFYLFALAVEKYVLYISGLVFLTFHLLKFLFDPSHIESSWMRHNTVRPASSRIHQPLGEATNKTPGASPTAIPQLYPLKADIIRC